MSLHREMLQVARLAPRVLEDAADLVRAFVSGRQNDDGGFGDRQGRSDLYYTVFGMDALLALAPEAPALPTVRAESLASFLESFGGGEGLDFVHLCCLARCRAGLRLAGAEWDLSREHREEAGRRITAHRSEDGGFNPRRDAGTGTAYGAFLGVGGMQDLGLPLEKPREVVRSLERLAMAKGGFANEDRAKAGSTNATAAALAVLRNLGEAGPPGAASWLLSMRHGHGGFKAGPEAPLPDLLSTATALHALSGLGVGLEPVREACLDFVDSLWTNEGGFHGHWADDELDVEYTYYGLLALGHLSTP